MFNCLTEQKSTIHDIHGSSTCHINQVLHSEWRWFLNLVGWFPMFRKGDGSFVGFPKSQPLGADTGITLHPPTLDARIGPPSGNVTSPREVSIFHGQPAGIGGHPPGWRERSWKSHWYLGRGSGVGDISKRWLALGFCYTKNSIST